MCENQKNYAAATIFYEIMVAEHGVYDHDLRKKIKILVEPFLFTILVFNMVNHLAILQVNAGKTMIKESHRE